MLGFVLSAIKIIFVLGFLVLIHECGHFFVAKLCKVRVNEFAIGFGPTLWKKQGKVTRYAIRLIPLGGFVSMEGEDEPSKKEGSFSETSVIKRIAIVIAGGLVNIIFAILMFWILSVIVLGFKNSFVNVVYFLRETAINVLQIFTGKLTVDNMVGPVGISNVISKTSSIFDFAYILTIISLSLGITNLLPFPPLDGGKVVLLIIEGIRKKPLNQRVETAIQSIGFTALIALSIFVTYNDILKIR